jgi:hypothetical protein
MLPLIRYATGDLVRRVKSDCSPSPTFDFLGKTVNCVGTRRWGSRTEWLLFSVDLYEILNELPDIRSIEHFANVHKALDRTVGAPLVFTLRVSEDAESGPLVILLTCELRYAPHCFPQRIAELEARIHEGLTAAETALGRRLEDGSVRLDIRFAGPGALGDAFMMKI